jgi:hypothetical protein
MALWAFQPHGPVEVSLCFGALVWRRPHAADPSVSESNLGLKLSTKDLLALASMKNVAKREM